MDDVKARFSLLTDKDQDVMAGCQPGYPKAPAPAAGKPLNMDPDNDPMVGYNPKFNKPALSLSEMYSPKIGLGLDT